jgi:hypothetical protein
MTEEQLKICTKCKGEFPATSAFYYKNKRSKNGLSSDCIVCRKKLMKASRDANPEKIEKEVGFGVKRTLREQRQTIKPEGKQILKK